MAITAAMIKDLREQTGAGVLDCRTALQTSGGDVEAAVAMLRKKGLAEVAKRSERVASDGLVEAYVHLGDRIGVMLEVNCETDFVARTDDFRKLAHNLALHIAFAAPRYLAREDVPEATVASERAKYHDEAIQQGKPERIVERIVDGRMEKFYQQVCLAEQPYVKDKDKTIKDLVDAASALLRENVIVRRFARYEVGEQSE